MRYLLITLITILFPAVTNAAIVFQFDGESGYQYMGSENAYPGGANFSQMGGNVRMPEGIYGASNCTPDTDNHHYSIISDDVAGQGSVPGSLHSLKTPYLGVCPNQAYQRDTTIISTPILYEGYIRWYQKWTGPWPGRTVQQKFTKFYDGTTTGSGDPTVEFTFEANRQQLTAFMRNTEGHFDKDGVTRDPGSLWVHDSSVGAGTPYPGQNRSYADYNNGINSGLDADFLFSPDRWYLIEIHWKVNTDANTSDGVLEQWVDGVKIFGVNNYKYFNTGARPYINTFELQHVYYDRSNQDQTTYMDNIIISTTALGGSDDITPPTITGISRASGTATSAKFSWSFTDSDNTGVTSRTYCTAAIGQTCTPTTPYIGAVPIYPGSNVCAQACDAANNCQKECANYPWPTIRVCQ